jgi:predicted DNA-binding transcriptional regulator AlpA
MTRPGRPRRDQASSRAIPRSRADGPAASAGGAGGDPVDLDAVLDTARPPRAGSGVGAVWRLGELSDLPASVSLLEAAGALGIGRTSAYNLARQGQFPCPLIRVGALYRVPTAGLLRLLALTPPTVPLEAEPTG